MKIRKKLYWAAVIALSAVFVVSAWYVADYYIGSSQNQEQYDQLAAMVRDARGETRPIFEADPNPAPEAVDTPPVMLDAYAELYEMNPDLVGWLEIPGTKINYPVLQHPSEDDYYLNRDFGGKYSAYGCLYVRRNSDVNAPSDNVTIHGHHMKDGSMLAGLDDYTSQSFWEENGLVYFDTLYEQHTYQVFAVFTVSASAKDVLPYHKFADAADEAEFDAFVARCKALSLYDTGITPVYGDKLICLSTCEYSRDDGRLVVAAVRCE